MKSPTVTQPSWRQIGRHAVFPQATHDEIARFDFLTRMNLHLSQSVLPGVKLMLVGNSSERLSANFANAAVHGTGYVEDPSPCFSRCCLAISRSG